MLETNGNASGDNDMTDVVVDTNVNSVDIDQLAERVYQMLIKELTIENERIGRRN